MSDCNSSHLHTSPGKVPGFESMAMILTQSDLVSHDQGEMLGPELNLTEMSEYEYTHLQHLIQTHMETQADVSDMPADQNTAGTKDALISPLPTTEAIDLSTSSDGHVVVLPGEKTPLCFGEVPGFVLAKLREEDPAPSNSCSILSKRRGFSTARVCLEKRFNSILGPKDDQSAVLSNFSPVVQQPSGTPDASAHLQNWIRNDKRNDMPTPVIGIYNAVTNIRGQVISLLEPNAHQSFVIPKGLPLNIFPQRILAKNHIASTNSTSGDKKPPPPAAESVQLRTKSRASKDMSDSCGQTADKKRAHGVVPPSLRRERHNSKERQRRWRIRKCCEELNKLVPFCQTDTDKVTTLRWTAAYLKYISNMYGDALKEEFQKIFMNNGLKPDPSSVNELLLHNIENVPMAAEP